MAQRRTRKAIVMAVLTVFLSTFALAGPMLSRAEAYPNYCSTKKKGGTTKTTCIHITKIYGRTFTPYYRDGIYNDKKSSATLTCTATTSKTMKYSVSTSVKAEAGAIFAKVSGEISGGLERSVTTSYGSQVSTKVPGHKTMFCDYGIYNYKFKGTVTRVTCVNVNCSSNSSKFSGRAPQRNHWHVYIGK
jgi:hypothetical protein